jgi:cellulose synthase/poly-beta-1,6-N-acetylglucosamine synthase-like glycosyltransferase
MIDIEIPLEKDRHGWYRFFEIVPGFLSWSMLALPFVLSIINVEFAALFVFVYLLINFTRGVAGATRVVQGYQTMRHHQQLQWRDMVDELDAGEIKPGLKRPKWHYAALARKQIQPLFVSPNDVIHAVIVATYKEAKETLVPTIESVLNSDYDMKKVIFILAYEERGGKQTEVRANELIADYQGKFMAALAVKHPQGMPGELIGKGGNVTYAGRVLQTYLKDHDIDPIKVVVTTLDADNRPDKQYFAALSYAYAAAPDPLHASFQPVALFTNNIWDAPAPMRVLATGNSFFHLVTSLRQHALRNFSAHAQPMAALIETDFWSVRTIVEDGHQFWRSYFRFDGNYRVYPIHLPIGQDAVLTDGYVKTLRAQFTQLRRWTYGASDVAYVVNQGFFKKNKVPRIDLIAKTARLLEGHVTWAVGPLLVLGGGFIPGFFKPDNIYAIQAPVIVGNIQRVATVLVFITLFLALKTLPPKPARYKRHRTLFMIIQWAYLPFTTVFYNSLAAFNSQTRLMFGWYLSKFDATEKTIISESGKRINSDAEQETVRRHRLPRIRRK